MNQLTNQLINHLTKIYDFALDLLFPKYCVGCGKEGSWICDQCKEKIIFIQKPTCPVCNRLTPQGQVCRRCRENSYLTGVIVAAYYEEGPLKEAIHTFKYEGVFSIAKDLGAILYNRLNLIPLRKWKQVRIVVVPVPLHKKRQAQRGFNQALLLAEQLKTEDLRRKTKDKDKGWELIKNKLIRHKYTKKTQVELSGKARRENVKGIFSWRGQQDELKGKTILLVDDIYTTGATLQECARVLRQEAGARVIWGIVLAKV